MKVVSFYCDIEGSSFYSSAAMAMKSNCDYLGIESLIFERKYGSTWLDNIQGKPLFIKEMFCLLDEPFIYVDVDSQINHLKFSISGGWGNVIRPMDGKPYDHVHYIDNNPGNGFFIDAWIKEVQRQKKCDHSAFLTCYELVTASVKNMFFAIPDDCFTIGLGKSKGRTEYLTWAENNMK